MATRTTSQDGNWTDASTWGGSAPPGIGDRAVIGHDVTVAANITVGESLSDSTNAIYCNGGPGSVTIAAGVTLTVRGFFYCSDAAAVTLEAGSVLEFEVPSGWLYSLKHYSQPLTINGTSGAPCTIRSKAGGGVANIALWGNFAAPIDADHCTFERLGDATTPALVGNISVTGSTVALRNCTFTADCGEVSLDNSSSGTDIILEDCRFDNTAGARSLLMGGAATAGSSFLRNAFADVVKFVGPAGWTVSDCYFGGLVECAGTAWTGAVLQRSLVRDAANADTNLLFPAVTDVYWLEDFTANNPHGFVPVGDRDITVDGVVFEYGGTYEDGDMILPSMGGTGTPRLLTVTNCLQVLGAGGSHGGSLVVFGGGEDVNLAATHNTGFCGEQAMFRCGENYAGHAGMFGSLRSNLVLAGGGATSEAFLAHDLEVIGTVSDLLTAANATHNAAGPGVSAGSNGKGYDNFTITSGTPGANDLTPGTDPGLAAPARNMGTWDDSLGGVGTTAAALARLRADPALTYSSLLPHVRGGFAPTNPAFATAAHDGTTVGAVPYAEGGGGGETTAILLISAPGGNVLLIAQAGGG